jgi:hypothetical protein
MQTSSITRFGHLDRVFENGSSELLNAIARLSVLYEDFRIERSGLAPPEGAFGEMDTLGHGYRMLYFLRRSVATLTEFHRGLTQILQMPGFKSAPFNKQDAEGIDLANHWFQSHRKRLKELRNEFGGHLQQGSVTFANVKASHGVVGKVVWNRSKIGDGALALELHFANEIIGGAISSKLQDGIEHHTGAADGTGHDHRVVRSRSRRDVCLDTRLYMGTVWKMTICTRPDREVLLSRVWNRLDHPVVHYFFCVARGWES